MLRPGGVARPAPARAFTTKLSWAGSPQKPTLVMTEWLIVICHCRTFTGWTDSLMGCEQRTQSEQKRGTRACSCGGQPPATRQTCAAQVDVLIILVQGAPVGTLRDRARPLPSLPENLQTPCRVSIESRRSLRRTA